jgi:hypothetical protein
LVLRVFEGSIRRLSVHPFGCRVVQRMLEHCRADQVRAWLALGSIHAQEEEEDSAAAFNPSARTSRLHAFAG